MHGVVFTRSKYNPSAGKDTKGYFQSYKFILNYSKTPLANGEEMIVTKPKLEILESKCDQNSKLSPNIK